MAPARGPEAVYLLVREELTPQGAQVVASVLTAGSKAAIGSGDSGDRRRNIKTVGRGPRRSDVTGALRDHTIGGAAPALGAGLTHRYGGGVLARGKFQDPGLERSSRVNPTTDLPGAEREGARIEKLFAGSSALTSAPAARQIRLAGLRHLDCPEQLRKPAPWGLISAIRSRRGRHRQAVPESERLSEVIRLNGCPRSGTPVASEHYGV